MPFGIIPTAAQPMYDDCSVTLTRKLWKYILWLPRFLELFAESHATRKILHQLRVPCCVFQSKQDEVVSLRSHRDLQKHPHYQLTLLENSGHYRYSPEDTALLLEAFAKIAADH
jgi:esterase/lipase